MIPNELLKHDEKKLESGIEESIRLHSEVIRRLEMLSPYIYGKTEKVKISL